jgi:tetratricopeptide (TPR) repeat protein
VGASLASALESIKNPTPQMRQAVLLDLLGDDRSLWPALRQLIEHPGFDAVRCHPSPSARQAGRDAWLQELATWCNQDSLARAGAFLDGLLGLQWQAAGSYKIMQTQASSQATNQRQPFNQSDASGGAAENQTLNLSGPGNTPATATRLPGAATDTPAEVLLLCDRALRAANRSELAAAAAEYTNAIHFDNADPWLYLQRSKIHARAGNLAEAAKDLSTAVQLSPNNRYLAYQQRQIIKDLQRYRTNANRQAPKPINSIPASNTSYDIPRNTKKLTADIALVAAVICIGFLFTTFSLPVWMLALVVPLLLWILSTLTRGVY